MDETPKTGDFALTHRKEALKWLQEAQNELSLVGSGALPKTREEALSRAQSAAKRARTHVERSRALGEVE
jgi:hypothetical protein